MAVKLGSSVVTTFIALISGCAAVSPQSQSESPKNVSRGAISGMPQHVGFYYSVNPDCSSDGLVQTQLKSPPAHGSVEFVKADGYTSFPSSSPSHACNTRKSPGIEVIYTSAKNFAGTDQFVVQGVGPKGKYMETDYTVRVLAP